MTYTLTDAAGNESGQSGPLTLTVDTTAPATPAAPTQYLDNTDPVQGEFGTGTSTNDTTPGLIIPAPAADETPKLYVDGKEVPATYDPATGTLTPTTPLTEGEHSLTYTLTDAAGNESAPSGPLTLTVDTTAPAAPAAPTQYLDNVDPAQGNFGTGTSTNDTTPGLLIPAPATGETPKLYVDGTEVSATYDPATGTLTPTTPLTEGEHSLTYTLTDVAGNESAQSGALTLTVDTHAPMSPTAALTNDTGIPGDGVTSNGEVTVYLTDSGVDSWQYSTDGGVTWSEVQDATSNTFNLDDGDYPAGQVQVREIDPAGNESAAYEMGHLQVYNGAPPQPHAALVNDTGVDDADKITSDGTLAITDVLPGFTWKYSLDGGVTILDGNSDNQLVLPVGTYNDVLIYQTNDIGSNGKPWSTGKIEVVAPITLGLSLAEDTGTSATDGITNNATINVTGISTLSSSKAWEYSTDGGTTWKTGSGTSFTLPADGSYAADQIQVRQSNPAFTTDATAKLGNVVLDTKAPVAPEILSVSIDNVVTGTAEANSKVTITFADNSTATVTASNTGAWSVTHQGIVNGSTITATATDAAGNTGPSTNFVVDTSAPPAPTQYLDNTDPVQGTFGAGTSTNDTTPGIMITAPGAGKTPKLYVDGVEVPATYDAAAGTLTPITPLAEGSHSFAYSYVDSTGNESLHSGALSFIIDKTPPNAPVINSLNTTGNITGTAEANSTVTVNLPNGTSTNVVANSKGEWSVSNPGLTANQVVTAYATDAAGNKSTNATATVVVPNAADLTTDMAVNVDTANGLVASGLTNTVNAVNTDLITRDNAPTQLSGNINRALNSGESLQISRDGGVSWTTVLLTGTKWTLGLTDTYTQDTTVNFTFRVINASGNTSALAATNNKQLVIDVTSPDAVNAKPVVPTTTTISQTYTFTDATYGLAEKGSTIALVNDVNGNGMWQEGIDKVVATATVDANGHWTITTKLPAGALNLGFMVWDTAGNISAMGLTSSVGVASTESGAISQTLAWGGTSTGYSYTGLLSSSTGYGMNVAAVTINEKGQWTFLQSTGVSDLLDSSKAYTMREYTITDPSQTSGYTYTNLSKAAQTNGGNYNAFVSGVTYVDLNRDGYADVIGQYSDYAPLLGSSKAPLWLNNGNGTYTALSISLKDTVHLTGIVAFDMRGDGYLDYLQGDSDPSTTMFVFNNGIFKSDASGLVTSFASYEANDGVATTGIPNGVNMAYHHNISVVDLNNDGITELAGNATVTNGVSAAAKAFGFTATDAPSDQTWSGPQSLVILYHDQKSDKFTSAQQVTNVFFNDAYFDSGATSINMSWADFNGDGYLDLYLNRGSTAISGHSNVNESRIFLNNAGTISDKPSYWFGDNNSGGTSFAVDWNLDGKMDVVEVPTNFGGDNANVKEGYAAFAPTLYLNNSTGTTMSFGAGVALDSKVMSDVTGAVVVDYDWDGTMELILYHGTTANVQGTNASANPTTVIKNTNIAADGTSLHIRILAEDGTNIYYGNTVKLYDSSGTLVATQIINAQTSGSSNSMGLLDFYGLKADEKYSVELLRSVNGVSNNVGGTASIDQITNGTVNTSWAGLKTGKSNEAYILTTDSDKTAVDTTKNVGIVGTGYNDHFFGTLGNDVYNGGGGWIIDGTGKKWVATGGQDILDYSLLGSNVAVSVNADLGIVTKIVTNTDGSTTKYTDIVNDVERFIVGSGPTTFTGGKGDDVFQGNAGNDTYNLGTGGGSDTIYFALLNATNATGGNGVDTVNSFHVGKVGTDKDADIIDIHELLMDNISAGLHKDSSGKVVLDASSNLAKYVNVTYDGANTHIQIDRDGTGNGTYQFTDVLILNGVKTDLLTLIQNNQIIV